MQLGPLGLKAYASRQFGHNTLIAPQLERVDKLTFKGL